MCGRFAQSNTAEELMELFRLAREELFEVFGERGPRPRFNVSPTQQVLTVRAGAGGEGGREAVQLKWGLVPGWSKDPAIGARMINARAETVAEKPSFRTPFRLRRCLVPASGYYEWRKEVGGKQPYFIHPRAGGALAFAGLWEEWRGKKGEVLQTFTIITTDSNADVEAIHNRMPVIVPPEQFDLWLDPKVEGTPEVRALLGSGAEGRLSAYPVSTHVNRPANDDPTCIEPLEAEGEEE